MPPEPSPNTPIPTNQTKPKTALDQLKESNKCANNGLTWYTLSGGFSTRGGLLDDGSASGRQWDRSCEVKCPYGSSKQGISIIIPHERC